LVEKTRRIELQRDLEKLDEIYNKKITEYEGAEKLRKALEDHNERLTTDVQAALKKFEAAQRTIKTLMQELQTERNANVGLRDDANRKQLEIEDLAKHKRRLADEVTKERDTAAKLRQQTAEHVASIAKLHDDNFANIDISQKKYDEL